MDETAGLTCPYCGEPVEVDIDEGGSRVQSFIEDCPVCCRPWQVEAMLGNDGTWTVSLRTEDE